MKDLQGRHYATVAATKLGDLLEADGDFTCIRPGSIVKVGLDADGPYVPCESGRHGLAGQVQSGRLGLFYMGFYPVENRG